MQYLRWSVSKSVLFLALAVGSSGWTFGQTPEAEPNDSCPGAQFVGVLGGPLAVSGSLDSTESFADIDFFRFSALAGQVVQVDLKGLFSGQGTLVDPYFGVFDSDCNLVTSFDYGGVGLDARGYFMAPPDGLFTIAATACCDWSFQGGGHGSYLMTAQTVVVADSLRGRLVDAKTGNPLPGTQPPYSYLELYRIGPEGPEVFAWANPDDNGEFLFESSTLPTPLVVGDYQIMTYIYGYQIFSTGTFSLGEGEARDLGDLPIQPVRVIGSISGRLVDAIDGRPVPSVGYQEVTLFRCEGDEGCFLVGGAYADGEGRFRFEPFSTYQILEPADYRVTVRAYQYESYTSDIFPVAEDEHRDLGDIPLHGLAIQFIDQKPCLSVPAGGGVCSFQVKLRNGSANRVKGEVWGRVDSYGTGSPLGNTTFQIGRNGGDNPAPQKINLASGQSQWIDFQFEVPGRSDQFLYSCVRTLAGQNPTPLFNTVGEGLLFCFAKEYSEFSILTGKEAWKKYQEVKQGSRP